jgi:hypothetical protein
VGYEVGIVGLNSELVKTMLRLLQVAFAELLPKPPEEMFCEDDAWEDSV